MPRPIARPRAAGVGSHGEQEGTLGRVILAAVGQTLAEGGVKVAGRGYRPAPTPRRPRANRVDEQAVRGGEPGQGVLIAPVLGERFGRRPGRR